MELFCVVDEEQDQLHLLFPGYRHDDNRRFPGEALYRAAARWAIDEGIATCNFGGTDPDVENGVYRFKSELGATPAPTLRWERMGSALGRVAYALVSGAALGSLFRRR